MPQKSSNPSDQVDNLIGHFGWYVGTLSIIASFVQILEGMNSVVSVFISAQTDYRCETCFDGFLVDIENSTEYENYDKLIVENFYKIKEKSSDKCDLGFDTCMVSDQVAYDMGNDTDIYSPIRDCCYDT